MGKGLFVASTGNVTDEIIAQYIKNQDIEENMKSDNFGLEPTGFQPVVIQLMLVGNVMMIWNVNMSGVCFLASSTIPKSCSPDPIVNNLPFLIHIGAFIFP